jgi:hypothetical protein
MTTGDLAVRRSIRLVLRVMVVVHFLVMLKN